MAILDGSDVTRFVQSLIGGAGAGAGFVLRV
jgi:hypothetical protein